MLDLISAILSLLGTVILIFTLEELYTQRIISYRPKPLLSAGLIFLQLTKEGFPAIWKSTSDDYYNENENSLSNAFRFDVLNSGLGPAIGLKIEWLVDKEKLINRLVDYSEMFGEEINISKVTKIVQYKSKGIPYSFEMFQANELFHHNIVSLAPYSNPTSSVSIGVPMSILYFYSIATHYCVGLGKLDELSSIPPVRLRFSYSDTGGKEYSDDYYLVFNFNEYRGGMLMTGTDLLPNKNYVAGDFELVRVSTKSKKVFALNSC